MGKSKATTRNYLLVLDFWPKMMYCFCSLCVYVIVYCTNTGQSGHSILRYCNMMYSDKEEELKCIAISTMDIIILHTCDHMYTYVILCNTCTYVHEPTWDVHMYACKTLMYLKILPTYCVYSKVFTYSCETYDSHSHTQILNLPNWNPVHKSCIGGVSITQRYIYTTNTHSWQEWRSYSWGVVLLVVLTHP